MIQEQREEKSMPILQELTPENPGGKWGQKQAQKLRQQALQPRPLATEVTNIHTEPSGRDFDSTSKLQKSWQ